MKRILGTPVSYRIVLSLPLQRQGEEYATIEICEASQRCIADVLATRIEQVTLKALLLHPTREALGLTACPIGCKKASKMTKSAFIKAL